MVYGCDKPFARLGHGPCAMFCLALMLAILAPATGGRADAQLLKRAFELEPQPQIALRTFVSSFGAQDYATMHEGFELDQALTGVIGLVGRVSAYQILKGSGYDNPLEPASGSAVHNFGRFEGGISLTPWQGTSFTMMGGRDAGDSDAPVIESDFSTWVALHSLHPLNFSYSANHFYENGVTNGLIDLRMVALSTANLMLLAGGGGAIWGGGTVGQANGQGGADIGLFLRALQLSIDTQIGYGDSGAYGAVAFSRGFSWSE